MAAETKQGESKQMLDKPKPGIDVVVDKVATAAIATLILQSGRGFLGTVAKSPWLMFGLGLTSGYLINKHRKAILLLSSQTAEQGKDFIERQQVALKQRLNADDTKL